MFTSGKPTVLVVLVASALYGQAFQHLVTNADGSVLYFSSPVRQRGSGQSLHSKIFRWDAAGGIRVAVEQRERGESDGCTYANFYELEAPSISADGAVLAYTASRPGGSSRVCLPFLTQRGIIQQAGREVLVPGFISISRNGRYAVSATTTETSSRYHRVTDLSSGASTNVAGMFIGEWDRITDEGAVLIPESMALMIAERNGTTRVFPTEHPVTDAVIDPTGRTAVYVTPLLPSASGRITRIDLTTGRETTAFTGFNPGNVNLSNDGFTIVFTERGQLYSGDRQVTNVPEGIQSAVLSGDGRIAYAATAASRLLRIDVASGAVTELAPSTPLITGHSGRTTIAPIGSLMEFFGSGLAGVRSVNVCGRDAPALQGRLRFQLPFDVPEGPCLATVHTESTFEHGIELHIIYFDPQFASGAIHGDFRGPVSVADPAVHGEVITMYMSGLGPVDSTGQLTRPGFNCQFDVVQAPPEYVSLAAGFPGFYQVNVRVPPVTGPNSRLACGWGPGEQATTIVLVSR